MKTRNLILILLAVVIGIALFVANRASRQEDESSPPVATPTPAAGTPPSPAVEPAAKRVPHFHAKLEDALPLPKILPASNFSIPVVARAYRVAARIPEVLAQQPCYCWCDKMGHGSLVDCFATDHGAGWAVCVKEVLLADQLTRAGLKPAEIREAIQRGDWETVQLDGLGY